MTDETEGIPWGEIYGGFVRGWREGETWGYVWGTYVMREHLEPVATFIRASLRAE